MKLLVHYVAMAGPLVLLGKLLERRGHRSYGRLLGVVLYDLGVPTFARLKAALWAPDGPHLITGTPFGVGWSPNFGALARKLGVA